MFTAQTVVRMAAKAPSGMAFLVYTPLIFLDTVQIRTLGCFGADFGGGLFDERPATLNGVWGAFVCVFLPTKSVSRVVQQRQHSSSGRSPSERKSMTRFPRRQPRCKQMFALRTRVVSEPNQRFLGIQQ